MKYSITILLIFILSCKSCRSQHYGERRNNRKELKIVAEAAKRASNDMVATFEITMYGDTATIHGDRAIEYKYHKELGENKYFEKLVREKKIQMGVMYWAAPIGYTIGINDYLWIVVKDTAFIQDKKIWAFGDTLQMFDLERLGIVKRKCNCR